MDPATLALIAFVGIILLCASAHITAPTDSRTLNKLFSDVMDHPVTREAIDNIFKANALLGMLTDIEDGKDYLSGGNRISVKVRLGLDTSVGSTEGYDPLDTTPQEQITTALFRTAEHYANVTVSFRELEQSGGEEGLNGLLADAVEGALGSLRDNINVALWKDGTGNNSKDLFGLAAFFPADPTTGTVGGVSRASNTAWRSNVEQSATGAVVTDLRTLYNECTDGDEVPTLGMCTTTAYELYEVKVAATPQFSPVIVEKGPRTGDVGFDYLRYKAARLVLDKGATGYGGGTNENIVLLNLKALKLYVYREADFTPTEMVKHPGQFAYVGQIRWHGNLVPLQLRRHGVVYDITA